MGKGKRGPYLATGGADDASAADRQRVTGALRHLEEDPARSAYLLDGILSLSSDHYYVFDRAGRLIYANLAAAEALGLEREAILGRSCLELGFPLEAASPFDTLVRAVFNSGTENGRMSLRTAGGIREFEYLLTTLRTEDGTVKGVVASLKDTARREGPEAAQDQLLERLREANQELVASSLREQESAEEARLRAGEAERALRAREEFLSLAAHELKTPLTGLRGFSQGLIRKYGRMGAVDQSQLVKALAHIDGLAKRLADITEQLLDVSRLETGRMVMTPKEAEISTVVEDALVPIKEAYPDRTLVIRDSASVRAYVDTLRMGQVVSSLVDNAVKFSPSETPVEIGVAMDGPKRVAISVRDYGRGISEGDRSRVFERFYQAHPPQHYGGMGLGLYISAQIVELHGGTITCEAPEGGGSRFLVRIPLNGLRE